MSLLKNRHMQVKFVRDDSPFSDGVDVTTVEPTEIAQIATDYTIKTIGAIGAVVAANRILKTICDVVIITAQAKIK
jgi:hypothetical protein